MTIQTDLSGKVAIITGASQGIGQAVAKKLAESGVHLFLCARNESKLQALAAELKTEYPTVTTQVRRCDVQQAEQVEAVAVEALKAFGRIDILINNAGVAPRVGLLQEFSIDDIDRTIDTNLKGPVYAIRAVLPSMVERQSGFIININSVAGKTAYPFWSVYCASKFALRAITQSVAEEQRGNGVRVADICPGAVNTAIWDGAELVEDPSRTGMLDPMDVADAVAYLLSRPSGAFVREVTLEPLKPVL